MAITRPPRAYEEGYYVWGGDIGATYYAEASPRCGLPDVASNADVLDLLNTLVANLGATYGNKITIGPGIYTGGLRTMVDDCEAGWVSDQGVNVVVSYDNVDFREGVQSLVLTVNLAAAVGLIAHYDLPAPVDISEYQAIGLWFKPSLALATGDFELLFDNTAGCGSPEVVVDIRHPEALEAGVWKFVKPNNESEYMPVDLTPVGTLRSIGVRMVVDPGAIELKLDEINVLRGTVWNTTNKPVWIEGAGTQLTQLYLNDRANTSMIVMTSDWQNIRNLTLDGNLANQDAIDGCSGIVDRYGDYSIFKDLYIHDTKGTGINLRDVNRIKALNIHGYQNENPVIAMTTTDYSDIEVYGRDILNDDPLWVTVGSDFNYIKVTADGGVGNLARIDGSVAFPSYNNEIHVFGHGAANAALQLSGYSFHTEAHVNAYDCLYGIQVISGSEHNTLKGTLRNMQENAVILTGDHNTCDGINVYASGWNAFDVNGDHNVITGCKGLGIGAVGERSGVNMVGNYNVVTGGSFRGFTRGGMRGIKEAGTPDYNTYSNVRIDGNTAAASIIGLHSEFDMCKGLNPYGEVVTPFDAATNSIEITGGAAAPVASTDYYIRNMDIVISSSDSGSTDCSIDIMDEAGNAIWAGLSTFDRVYLPVGWRINWGAYTGAAPTVPVGFN